MSVDEASAPARPSVRVRVEVGRGATVGADDGLLAELFAGDLIGRVWTAALPIDHPSLSEAHALVSLRDGAFWLLALRRRMAVDGVVRSEVRLAPGVRVALADEVAVVVEEVALPDRVLTLDTEHLPPTVLPSVCSVRALPHPSLVGRFDPEAPCVIWTSGAGWRIRLHGDERSIGVGDAFEIDGVSFRIGTMPLDVSGPGVTRVSGGVDAPLVIVSAFDVVQIHREDEPILVLNGVQARLVSELATMGAPVGWRVVADEIWPNEGSEQTLRKRWDVAVTRTRARLRVARIRPDLIRADGKGTFELVLRPEDRVEDRT